MTADGSRHTNESTYGAGGDCLECGVMWPCPTEGRRREAPRCKCHGLKSQHGTDRRGRPICFHSGMCGCTEYRPTSDPIADAVQRHPGGKAIPEVPQTADIQDYLRQKGEIS